MEIKKFEDFSGFLLTFGKMEVKLVYKIMSLSKKWKGCDSLWQQT